MSSRTYSLPLLVCFPDYLDLVILGLPIRAKLAPVFIRVLVRSR